MRRLSIIASISVLIALSFAWTAGLALAAEPKSMSHANSVSAEMKLRQDMRKLWTDHVVWTRDYIIAAVDDKPDAEAASKRLLRNQEDIGKAIASFYGKEAGEKLTSLLKEHIMISVDIIKAAKAKDNPKVKQLNATWEQNGDDIADFLARANPNNWPKATLADMMKAHLSTTTDELMARLDKKWDQDVKAFDKVYEHILGMADALSDGIVKQFPDKFT